MQFHLDHNPNRRYEFSRWLDGIFIPSLLLVEQRDSPVSIWIMVLVPFRFRMQFNLILSRMFECSFTESLWIIFSAFLPGPHWLLRDFVGGKSTYFWLYMSIDAEFSCDHFEYKILVIGLPFVLKPWNIKISMIEFRQWRLISSPFWLFKDSQKKVVYENTWIIAQIFKAKQASLAMYSSFLQSNNSTFTLIVYKNVFQNLIFDNDKSSWVRVVIWTTYGATSTTIVRQPRYFTVYDRGYRKAEES